MAREIRLGGRKYTGHVAIVDDEDYERIAAFRWSPQRHERASGKVIWYAQRQERGAIVLMHRVVIGAPAGVKVDHRDGDGLRNVRENIRLATDAENARNIRNLQPRKTSRFLGVSWAAHARKWRMQIAGVHGGYFDDEEGAARAFAAAARVSYGEFAPTSGEAVPC